MATNQVSVSPAADVTRSHHVEVPGAKSVAVMLTAGAIVSSAAIGVRFGWYLSLLPIAFACGITQVGGRCGTAHVNAMTTALRRGLGQWAKAAGAYTGSGCISSTVTGIAFGALGILLGTVVTSTAVWLVTAVSVIVASRELGLISIRLPERDWQTYRNWAYKYTWTTASALWGLHIGVGFATVITYGSYWVLVIAAVVSSSPVYGAMLMLVYWLGRCAPLWILPLRYPNAAWSSAVWRHDFHLANALAVSWLGVSRWLFS